MEAVLFSALEKDYEIDSLSALCSYLHFFIFSTSEIQDVLDIREGHSSWRI